MDIPRIIIVGGGAGGLELATRLGKRFGKRQKAEIFLVDANHTHVWKPRLHEVAAGVLDANLDELSYAAHAHRHHFQFVLGKMCNLDRASHEIELAPYSINGDEILPARRLRYAYLVMAVGSQTNDFGTPGAKENCIFLDQRQAAETFHKAFLNVYIKASYLPKTSSENFNVAIVGAGATGVELAAELNHAAHRLTDYGFDGLKPENVKITVIEAADRVLPVLSPKASAAIDRQLQKLNIEVLTNELVTEVSSDGLHTKSGKFIPAQLSVWSAGVKAPNFLADLDGLETNRINQLVVRPTLQTTRDDCIFAFGDCAQCPQPGQTKPVPPRAQAANQQATLLSRSFAQLLNGQTLPEFVYKDKGSLISLSTSGSVGNLMGNLSKDFTFEGRIARLFYITLYRLHQAVLHGWPTTLLLMLRDWLNRNTGPTLKLH